MKKFTKLTAIMLALCLCLSMAACDSNSSKTSKKDKKDKTEKTEETASVEDHNATIESVIADIEASTTEETTEETTTEESTEPEVSEAIEVSEEMVFDKYMEKIDEIHAEDPDALFMYEYRESYDTDSLNSLYVLRSGADEVQEYYCKNGEVIDGEKVTYYEPSFTYDEIKNIPVIATVSAPFVDSVEDGTYFGGLWGFSLDGTKALVTVGTPVILSADEYAAIKPGDVLPYFGGLTVSDDYDGSSTLYFEMEDMWFTQMEDGSYILITSSDCVVHENNKMLIVDIASDCDIQDHFAYLYGDPENVQPDNFLSSNFYAYMTGNESGGEYHSEIHGWNESYGILEPVVIENNTITSATFGWR